MATAKKPDPNRGRRRKPAQPVPDATQVPQPEPAADSTVDAPEKGPLRRCIVTRESGPQEAMLRFVLGPDRALVPDLAGKLPGRGMWLSARADVLERAIKRGAFAKAARGTVHLPPDLAARIEDGLKGRIRDLVGFARRSGKAVCGRESVREWLQAGKAGLLVEASDGSAAERSRLVGRRELPVVAPLPADVLGSVFARDHAVHVAIAPGRLAEAIALETARLAGMFGAGNGAGVQGAGAPGAATPSPRGDGAGHRRDGPMGQ
jgi:predicted RNA-binding protein YlxR (DUF448 family)